MSTQTHRLWIGTSNVVVPGNKSTFPTAFQSKSRLHYYSSLFNSVEINSSFYRIPMTSTYEKWSKDVSRDFRFSIKLSKEITHAKGLETGLDVIEKFMKTAAGIGNKKACLLVQFPGMITLRHFQQVEEIMKELEINDPHHQWKKALEFRSPGWYVGETWEMLDEYGATVVLHDIPKAKLWEAPVRANHIYIRFHGPKGDYDGGYSNHFLNQKAEQIAEWLNKGKEVYVYFNNTIGNAFENAVYLKGLLGG